MVRWTEYKPLFYIFMTETKKKKNTKIKNFYTKFQWKNFPNYFFHFARETNRWNKHAKILDKNQQKMENAEKREHVRNGDVIGMVVLDTKRGAERYKNGTVRNTHLRPICSTSHSIAVKLINIL